MSTRRVGYLYGYLYGGGTWFSVLQAMRDPYDGMRRPEAAGGKNLRAHRETGRVCRLTQPRPVQVSKEAQQTN